MNDLLKWTLHKVDLLTRVKLSILLSLFILSVTNKNLLFFRRTPYSSETPNDKTNIFPSKFVGMAYALILGICAVTLIVLTIAAVLSEKVRNAVISSRTYKKAFAGHMNIFSSIHNRAVQNRKEDMFAYLRGVQGDILEIGAGTGANFEFLPEGSSVIALEPNPHMESYLRENVKKFPHINLKQVVAGFAENMEGIADESVEAVICTLTLCSVHDVEATLSEIKRVLKPVSKENFTLSDSNKCKQRNCFD